MYQAPVAGNWQTTPLVVDGVMYITQRLNDVVALDATTGRAFWIYRYTPRPIASSAAAPTIAASAILGDTLFMGTLDAHLIAIDAKNRASPLEHRGRQHEGRLLDHARAARREGQGDRRAWAAASTAFAVSSPPTTSTTGREAWRFYTIPAPGEPGGETWERCPPQAASFCDPDAWKHGGGSIWMTGSYDPQLNLTYWGVGNVGPDYNGVQRPGDNLYTDSVVALDVDTGKLKWHYQFTPHDVYDYDSVQVPVLVDNWAGSRVNVIAWANRNGNFYVLDRDDGTVSCSGSRS